jgi:HD-like signal output (HDOD) protein
MATTPGTKHILFVDDEPRVLDALKRSLKGMRNDWSLTFCGSGAEAIQVMDTKAVDVIVADLRMPDLDGASLLKYALERHPDTVRIIATAPKDHDAALRALPIAHQYLTKPIAAAVVWQVVERCFNLRERLAGEELHRAVSKVQSLPVMPVVYREITRALQEGNTSMPEIAAIVAKDPAICAKLLQIVNSGLMGLARKVGRLDEAVTILGLAMMKDLVLSAGVFRQLEQRRNPGFDLEQFQKHAILTAYIARELTSTRSQAQEAFTAGMLHDLGRVLVDGSGSVSHAEAGGYLLGLWGLPVTIVEAVAFHHTPGRVPGENFGIVGAVHVADLLAHELAGTAHEPGPEQPLLDEAYLKVTGVADKLPAWRELAQLATVAERA